MAGAAIGLLRLQDTYRLDTRELANGVVQGKKIGKELSGAFMSQTLKAAMSRLAHDCFEIGRLAYNAEDYYHTLLWMQESMDRAEKENPPTATEADILEYLAFALYKQGNVKRALLATDRLYKICTKPLDFTRAFKRICLDPGHPRAKGNIKWYEDQLLAEGVRQSEMRKNIPPLDNIRPADNLENTERTIYEALCRNEVPRVCANHIRQAI